MSTLVRSILTAALLSVALLALGVEAIAPQLPPYAGPPDARTQRSLRLPAAARIEVLTADGSIHVAVSEDDAANSCEILADVRLYRAGIGGKGNNPAGLLAKVVSAESENGVIHVRSLPDDWPADVAAIVKYTLTVPKGTDIVVRGVNGNVWVAEGCGKVSVESGNADIDIQRPAGPVVARTTNGRLRLLGGRGPAVLETVNGSIRADMLAGTLTASSVNGKVQAELRGPEVLACALRSENGDVNVGLGDTIGFTLDASAARGSVAGDTGLPLDSSKPGAFRSREGSGETRLTLSSANGSIRLTRK